MTTGTKDEDEIRLLLSTSNHNDILFFTSKGRVFQLPVYELPETSRTAKGQPIINFLGLQRDEEVTALLDITKFTGKHLFFATKRGTVKRLDIEAVSKIRTSGLIVLKIAEDDELGWVRPTDGNNTILMASEKGQAIHFDENDVRVMGRAAAGVRGIRLKPDDTVIETVVVPAEDSFVFSVTQRGLGKITNSEEYRTQNRGGTGIKVGAITKKTGNIIGVRMLSAEDRKTADVVLISKAGQTVRMPLKGVRKTGRVAQGVILTKLKNKSDSIVSYGIIRPSDEDDE